MKRATVKTAGTGSPKRIKTSHSNGSNFFDQVPEQCPTDIVANGVDEEKWLTGKFKMVWSAINGRMETLVSVHSSTSSNDIVFPIFFELEEKHLARLILSPLSQFRLSLKGAQLNIIPKKHLSTLPIQLLYSKGLHIMWKPHGLEDIKTINTWSTTNWRLPSDNTWYNSEEEEGEQAQWTPVISIPSEKNSSAEQFQAEEIQQVAVPDISKESKKRQRLEIKRQKKEALANATGTMDNHNVIDPSGPPLEISRPIETKSSSSTENVTVRLGTTFARYQPISHVRLGQIAQLSGVVVGVSQYVKKTARDEWMCFVEIADTSSSRSDATGQWKGIKVNCFTKRHKEWLPFLQRGDAVILRDVKIEQFHDKLSGVGSNNRLRWAAYSAAAGEIYYGPPNDAPKSEKLADGFGMEFSPFYEPDQLDIQHLITLSDWWRKVAEKDKSDSVVPSHDTQITRSHRLISEAGPYMQPNGYFDCTVEILKVHLGSQGIHSLFVTDYTPSTGSSHASKSWPSSLNDCILQIEMWDDAARFAETSMKPGEYYSLKNVRIRISRGGFLEGKMQQEKITQLEDRDSQNDIYLNALLRRKKEWESKEMYKELDAFRLIQDAEEGRFFDCVVELLHILVVPNRMPCLYFTDYSASTCLSITGVHQEWSNNLDGRIIQVMLSDEQSNITDSAVVGTFWSVRNLRIKHNEVENCNCGILGGGEKLLVPLNVNRADNTRLNDLLKRKEAWAKTIQTIEVSQQPVVTLLTGLPRSLSGPENQNRQSGAYTRIRDMPLQNLESAQLRIVAKVVDFYPLELKDAFYQNCTSCNKEIPSNHRACASCDDFEHEYIRYLYQMFILIEDLTGDQIRVSVNDKCPLFAGLKRAHLREDGGALKEFMGRVKPLVGNLTSMHDGLKAGNIVDVDMPFLCFQLNSWVIPEATRAFSLTTYEEVDSI